MEWGNSFLFLFFYSFNAVAAKEAGRIGFLQEICVRLVQ